MGSYAMFLTCFEILFVCLGQYSAKTEAMNAWISVPFTAIGLILLYILAFTSGAAPQHIHLPIHLRDIKPIDKNNA
jgi:hypothetical protein